MLRSLFWRSLIFTPCKFSTGNPHLSSFDHHSLPSDIKPHNVMIDAEGHLILIDYGLAKQDVSHPNGAISLVGTPDYSAPEILKTAVMRSPPSWHILTCLRLESEGRMKNGKQPKVPSPEASEQYG